MTRADALRTIAAAFTPAPATISVPVFMYHHVNDTRPEARIARGLTLPTGAFEAQLRWLADRRIATMTTGELVDAIGRGHVPRDVAVLTFDDGYADAATIIAPLLKRYNARGTFFINAGTIGQRGHVSYRDLRAMHSAGNEIGAHGMHHLDLATLTSEGQLHEAGDCVDRIARYTGVRPVSYAYASGAYNATTLALMPAIGIRSAWTEHPGRVLDLHDPYEMPRLRIARHATLAEFAAMVTG